jgi:hypothetical protein
MRVKTMQLMTMQSKSTQRRLTQRSSTPHTLMQLRPIQPLATQALLIAKPTAKQTATHMALTPKQQTKVRTATSCELTSQKALT